MTLQVLQIITQILVDYFASSVWIIIFLYSENAGENMNVSTTENISLHLDNAASFLDAVLAGNSDATGTDTQSNSNIFLDVLVAMSLLSNDNPEVNSDNLNSSDNCIESVHKDKPDIEENDEDASSTTCPTSTSLSKQSTIDVDSTDKAETAVAVESVVAATCIENGSNEDVEEAQTLKIERQESSGDTTPNESDNPPGVNWLSHSNVWRARWVDECGKEISRSFSVEKFGDHKARLLATAARKEAEETGKAYRNGLPVKNL